MTLEEKIAIIIDRETDLIPSPNCKLVTELSDLFREEVRGIGEEIKQEIAKQFDRVKVVPKDPAKQPQADIMHTLIVATHQEPVSTVINRYLGEEGGI
jgi:hypothetical protein